MKNIGNRNSIWIIIVPLLIAGCLHTNIPPMALSPDDFELISEKIFLNETGGNLEFIVCWNKGEDFLSLGLGHFIWYQKNNRKRFKESFPELLNFMRERGEKIPCWLEKMEKDGYPWKNRGELLADLYPNELSQLISFLNSTRHLQIAFIFNRIEKALPNMLVVSGPKMRKKVKYQFYRVAGAPGGIYALTDYVNFKGEGISENEAYNGVKWGLLQVLENMEGRGKDINALKEFVMAAKKLLKNRVLNAPSGIDESRWLPTWERRLDSYCKE